MAEKGGFCVTPNNMAGELFRKFIFHKLVLGHPVHKANLDDWLVSVFFKALQREPLDPLWVY